MRVKTVLGRTVRSAALLALLLVVGLAMNLLLFGYAVFRLSGEAESVSIAECAAALEQSESEYALPEELTKALERDGRWLMLLDSQGDVVYSFSKPPEIPLHFSLSQVASFTRWYLMDYPVRVRVMGDGLLVIGARKDSLWKYSFETAMPTVMFYPAWIGVTLLCNFLLILIVSAAAVERSYKKTRRGANGMDSRGVARCTHTLSLRSWLCSQP